MGGGILPVILALDTFGFEIKLEALFKRMGNGRRYSQKLSISSHFERLLSNTYISYPFDRSESIGCRTKTKCNHSNVVVIFFFFDFSLIMSKLLIKCILSIRFVVHLSLTIHHNMYILHYRLFWCKSPTRNVNQSKISSLRLESIHGHGTLTTIPNNNEPRFTCVINRQKCLHSPQHKQYSFYYYYFFNIIPNTCLISHTCTVSSKILKFYKNGLFSPNV